MQAKKQSSPYRHILLAVFAVGCIIAAGTAGYMLLEGWSVLDALYMTVITIATVGFREVRPLNTGGMLFTVGLILVGVTGVAFVLASVTEFILQGTFQNYLGRARMEKELKTLDRHYIICGYGRMGHTIGQQFEKQRLAFVAIDASESAVEAARQDGVLTLHGDAGTEAVLLKAGVERAQALICTCSDDANNLLVTLTARGLNPKLFIVARVEEPASEKKLRQVGADKIISPYYLGALRIAQAVMRPAAFNFIETSTLNHEFGLTIDEMPVGKTSRLSGLALRESGFREKYDVMILGIETPEGRLQFNPPPDTQLTAGDKLVLMGEQKNLVSLAEWAGV
ncbi:MAG: potassium channel protein [Fibrobacterota bacterium]